MDKNIRNIIASSLVAACIAGSGSAVVASNMAEKNFQEALPTPQIIYVTPEPTIAPTPEPTIMPAPEPTIELTPEPTASNLVSIYVTPDYYIYTVQPGDTLYNIAKMFNVSIHWLAGVNQIENLDIIEVGQEIRIPKD